MMIFQSIFSPHFYNELRTNQQVAYDLGYFNHYTFDSIYLNFYIQTDKFSPIELASKFEEWTRKIKKYSDEISDESFESEKESLIKKLRAKPETQGKMLENLDVDSIQYSISEENFNEKLVKEIEKLSKVSISELTKQLFFDKSSASIEIATFKNGTKPSNLPKRIQLESLEKLRSK